MPNRRQRIQIARNNELDQLKQKIEMIEVSLAAAIAAKNIAQTDAQIAQKAADYYRSNANQAEKRANFFQRDNESLEQLVSELRADLEKVEANGAY